MRLNSTAHVRSSALRLPDSELFFTRVQTNTSEVRQHVSAFCYIRREIGLWSLIELFWLSEMNLRWSKVEPLCWVSPGRRQRLQLAAYQKIISVSLGLKMMTKGLSVTSQTTESCNLHYPTYLLLNKIVKYGQIIMFAKYLVPQQILSDTASPLGGSKSITQV